MNNNTPGDFPPVFLASQNNQNDVDYKRKYIGGISEIVSDINRSWEDKKQNRFTCEQVRGNAKY